MSDTPTTGDLPSLISTGQRVISARLWAAPDFAMYESMKNQLKFLRTTVEAGRKSTDEEKERLTIGVYAARKFESDPDFANVLFDIAYLFGRSREEGESRPMTLKGKDAEEFAEAVARRNLELQKQQLTKAIAEANARGKEPFDLAQLEQLCDTSREGRVDPVEDRRARFEYKYYVENPEIMTIAEFASLVSELSKW